MNTFGLHEFNSLNKSLAGIFERRIAGVSCWFRKDDFSERMELFCISGITDFEKLREIIEKSKHEFGVTKVLRATEQEMLLLKQIEDYRAVNIGEENIYATKDLREMKGGDYRTLRQDARKLDELISIKTYEKNDKERALEFLKTNVTDRLNQEELVLNIKALNFIDQKNIRGLIFFFQEKVVGLEIYVLEKKEQMIYKVFLKTEYHPRGLAGYSYHDLARRHPTYTYLNSGNFGKREGLKSFKQGLKPIFTNQIYKIFLVE
jgi:hypothetical protein